MNNISIEEYKSLPEKMSTKPKVGERYIKPPRQENLSVGKTVWWLEVEKVELEEEKISKIGIKVNMGNII